MLKSPLAFSFEFHQVLWDLMVSVVSVVFACLGGFGGFWYGPPEAFPAMSFDFHQVLWFWVVLVVFNSFGGFGCFL